MLNHWLTIAALASFVALGCSPPCETSDTDPVRYKGGTAQGSIYETSPFDGQYLHFPGGRRYQIEHRLGVRPPLVVSYVAFEEYPLKGNNVSENAGNQGVIEAVNDEIIQIRNDTCAELYLRVVAYSGGPVSDAGSD